jgi:hypothetical protein
MPVLLGSIKPKPKKHYWEYHITKFGDFGDKILSNHRMVVQRQDQYNALTVVRKKYPVREGYYAELNRDWYK